MPRKTGRPPGEITHALLAAATTPATITALAHRAQVGYAAAHYTACRLLERGDLVRLSPPRRKPALVVAREHAPAEHVDAGAELQRLTSIFAPPR